MCGLPSELAQTRPRGAPTVPTGYTLCRATVGKAVNGQCKHPRAKRSKALLKGICLGVKTAADFFVSLPTLRILPADHGAECGTAW